MSPGEKIEPDRETTDVVWQRVGAQIVDNIIQIVLGVAVPLAFLFVLASVSGPLDSDAVRPVLYLLVGGTWLAYNTILEGLWNGQTVGKKLAGIKVVDWEGREPTITQAFERNIPAIIGPTLLIYAVALAFMATDDFRQRLFDGFADTFVVDVPSTTPRSGVPEEHRRPGGRGPRHGR